MDRTAGEERGSHPSLGWGLPPYTGDHGRVKVIVAGAGIGGLTAALSLHAAGIDVLVIDAAHPMYPVGANGGSQAIVDARVLARALSSSGTPAEGLAAYEAARRQPVNAIVLANRDMPADRLLHLVSERAPGGFGRIEDVLSAAELAAFDQAYRSTTLQDVAALNSRPSLTP
jgi:2-polyprenyl-6-methoxyphenol hydroxylase-like FAD-dependent oxidoreductase